ncbi:hypothetical protein TSMEX_000227 [Taenia solium]|eukprot:TsM_000283900 transcript=TsM_000283900 gene=TsM_000283900
MNELEIAPLCHSRGVGTRTCAIDSVGRVRCVGACYRRTLSSSTLSASDIYIAFLIILFIIRHTVFRCTLAKQGHLCALLLLPIGWCKYDSHIQMFM